MNTNVPHPDEDLRAANRPFVKSRIDGLLEQEYLGGKLPAHIYYEQQPWHRTLATLLAMGKSRKECAALLERSEPTINELVRQPWFRTMLKELTDAAGKDLIKTFLEGEIIPSLEVLRTIRDDTSQKGPTRVAAANSILDRGLGKPVATIESTSTLNIHTAGRAADSVESELEQVRKQIANLRGVTTLPADGRS